ncbi:lytic transglycosylase domain-containing protein [Microtetraspora fusca]|uniref:aggregation-promoting factor C-terminal-like domain-containing protein n=1 Tax=Microtetraspora fusca TaxID=1997 RepID=UPI000B037E4C|nr:lytic transglycosylase domain-containing protein [Microtetraspora fusca]
MDSNRVSNRVLVRNTAVAMIAVSVVGGVGSGTAASAEQAQQTGRTAAATVKASAETSAEATAGKSAAGSTAAEPALTGSAEAAERQADAASVSGITTVHTAVWRTSAQAVKPKVSVTAPAILNKAYAFRLVARRSWPGTQFQCLDSLWTRESGWNHRAENPYSGAYGIPQALPGNKMSGTGLDWQFNPLTQIRWGLKYIRTRYGSPCGAWGHFQSHNWY